MAEFGTGAASGGWVHSCSFSASGDRLAYVAHDSSVTVVDGASNLAVVRLTMKELPLRCVTFVTENSLVGAGFDYVPFLFTFTGSAIEFKGSLDIPQEKAGKTMSAMERFKTLDRKGTTDTATVATNVNSTHQNAISALTIFKGDKSKAQVLCTTGVDGLLVLWDLAKAAAAASATIA